MKYVLSNRLIEFANRVAQIPGMKKLLSPIYFSFVKFIEKKRNSQFNKYGLDVLNRFHKVLSENGYEYTLAFGTLLGAISEKGFIKHDFDIDVAMWAEDWSPQLQKCLEKAGFKLWHTFEVDKGKLGREETYVYNNVSIDIFYFYSPINKYPYCCDFTLYSDTPSHQLCMKKYGGCPCRRLELPMIRNRVLTEFGSSKFYIPSNATEILEFRYGKSYMIPNPQWNINSYDNHIIEWKDEKGIYKEYT